MAAWTIEVLRDIDAQIAEVIRRQDIENISSDFRLREIELRLTRLERAAARRKPSAVFPTTKELIGSIWFKTILVLVLLAANFSLGEATKILSAFGK